jgi:N-acetylglucosamine malate deacetylase 2
MESEICIRDFVAEAIEQLTRGRTLVLVAHADDEAITCGALLQRMKHPFIVFATDGAPNDKYFWERYGSRERYAEVRRQEAAAAMAAIGVGDYDFVRLAEDQELFRNLADAAERLRSMVNSFQPDAILTSAYEGGHPDHDACAFLAAEVGRWMGVPVFEAPLYNRFEGVGHKQQFIIGEYGEPLGVTEQERMRKAQMFACYESQGDLLGFFDIDREIFRKQHAYDFSQPPHPGKLNYEVWQWPMTGADVCRAFQGFVRKVAA